ncbi:nucleolar complex protein [Ceratocystis lukuohia]|uniref:Nucleolar complex protein n=1 Tax=Ceratocystis lukuohia TaxID=2019550 RepID=A0ABR4MB17_9PEZI
MPSSATKDALKRKRKLAGSEAPKKRRRSVGSDDGMDVGTQILELEAQILESKKHYNNLTKLFDYIEDYMDNSELSMLSAVACCRVFIKLLAAGRLLPKKGLSEKDLVVVQWLRERYVAYRALLLTLMSVDELSLTILTLIMKLLKVEAQYLNNKEEYQFPPFFATNLIKTLLEECGSEVRKEFISEFVDEFDDIRYFTLRAVKTLVGTWSEDRQFFDTTFEFLSAIDGVPDSNDELQDFYIEKPKVKSHPLFSVIQHKRQAQDAWLALMAHGSTKDRRKKILNVLVETIAPWFLKPELLADFLTDCYNMGGATSLLALSGVFYLIENRNLDYPSFYTKLYSLLDRDILHSKHRSKFFRLMDTFLSSSHLPAALVASFIKRLARLALSAPPSAVVFVVPWVYNMFRAHPLCTFLLHREIRDSELKKLVENEGFGDPFNPDEADPMETGATDSCLWELVQLQNHYHPNVATIAKIISEQFTKQSYNLEDFLDHSYNSLLEAEMSKDVRKAPVVEFQIPKRIFLPQDKDSGVADNLVVKLWEF